MTLTAQVAKVAKVNHVRLAAYHKEIPSLVTHHVHEVTQKLSTEDEDDNPRGQVQVLSMIDLQASG